MLLARYHFTHLNGRYDTDVGYHFTLFFSNIFRSNGRYDADVGYHFTHSNGYYDTPLHPLLLFLLLQ
ncbi:Uncharacterized protein TCM_025119 [Theobroma cacao]|uniref:Uncharacterized protein n=1 Tax=Theobroma cacao TaxID=3641 RepID=A0A061EZB5_THECC|nr:Uncharacterized protein TCM_025119 [Theobroma cacao]